MTRAVATRRRRKSRTKKDAAVVSGVNRKEGGSYFERDLTEHHYAEIIKQAESGVSPSVLTRQIVDEWGYFKEKDPRSVERNLRTHLRNTVKREMVDRIVSHAASLSIDQLVMRVDALAELEELVHIQKGRLHKIMTQEEKVPTLLIKQVSDELGRLTDMLVRVANLQMELGIIRRAPKTFVGGIVTEPLPDVEVSNEVEKLFAELRGKPPAADDDKDVIDADYSEIAEQA